VSFGFLVLLFKDRDLVFSLCLRVGRTTYHRKSQQHHGEMGRVFFAFHVKKCSRVRLVEEKEEARPREEKKKIWYMPIPDP
jgi:hypothetical protein